MEFNTLNSSATQRYGFRGTKKIKIKKFRDGVAASAASVSGGGMGYAVVMRM